MAEDRVFPTAANETSSGVIGLASPKDRFAAYLIDVVLLVPLVQLLQAPLNKWRVESLLFHQGEGVSFYRMMNLFIVILVFLTYFTLMTWWKGQTLGKMFFKLKVISYHGHLSFKESLLRSFFIFTEFLMLGYPFLAIFSHSLRRPIHDRVSDTLVISLTNPIGIPTKKEVWQARALAVSLTLLMMASSFVLFLAPDAAQNSSLLVSLGQKDCDKNRKKVDDSLEGMLELHIVKEASAMCLRDVAREKLWDSEEETLAFFAMAIALKSDKLESDEYLSQVCRSDEAHELCYFSQWLDNQASKSGEGYEDVFNWAMENNSANFIKVYLASYLREKGDYSNLTRLVKSIEYPGHLEPIVASLSFHGLVGLMKWQEAWWVYKTHNHIGENDVLKFLLNEREVKTLEVSAQLDLIRFFAPDIGLSSQARGPASLEESEHQSDLRDYYESLLEGL